MGRGRAALCVSLLALICAEPQTHAQGLTLVGRGERLSSGTTTDVWVLGDFAYIGTFTNPCGDGTGLNGSGVRIFDVSAVTALPEVGLIPSVLGTRANDVKVASMNSGDILVHSNERCDFTGVGGFEIWNVNDPTHAIHLASVRVDELNEIANDVLGGVTNVGVHNLWLFQQDTRDYVAVVVGSGFDNFRIFDITDPTIPSRVAAWGAEELFDPGVGDLTFADPNGVDRVNAVFGWLFDGFGDSKNRFLHDITISADGTRAYLSNWDAGLVLLDISNPFSPSVISVALDPVNGSPDGEVNSHAAWPSADGTVVVETEEDFSADNATRPIDFTFQILATNTIPGVSISTLAGDDFEANQLGNSVTVTAAGVTVDAGPLSPVTYAAHEGEGNQPKLGDTGPISGEAVWIGRACSGDPIINLSNFSPGDIAIVRRGVCFFSEKLAIAAALGATAIVISNDRRGITPWGGVRIWDYSDPANPRLASTFLTDCAAMPTDESCDVRGTYTVHNVIVEDRWAFISWYSDGVLVLDISDPYNPVEVARYHETDAPFEVQNGGIQDVWGIYKVPGESRIYASDRNGGLYVLLSCVCDFNGNGLVDLGDHAAFTQCAAGPGVVPNPPAPITAQQCLDAFDFDNDLDVDLFDFTNFSKMIAGS